MRHAESAAVTPRAAAQRVLASRALAWGLWLGSWLGLGFAGVISGAPLGGLAPLALWLGGTALGLAAVAPRTAAPDPSTMWAQRADRARQVAAGACRAAARCTVWLLAPLALAALALWAWGAAASVAIGLRLVAEAAPALAVWLVAAVVGASLQVRAALRAAAGSEGRHPALRHPSSGAALGAAGLVAAVALVLEFMANSSAAPSNTAQAAIDLIAFAWPAGLAMGVAAWALWVTRWGAHRLPLPTAQACKRRLFDGVWAWPQGAQAGRADALGLRLVRAPLWAASAAMVPMMATLPHMAQWCAPLGLGTGAVLLAHGAVMAAGAAAGVALTHLRASAVPAACTAALLGGGSALWAWPDLRGLMAAGAAHAWAWGLAWALLVRAPTSAPPAASVRASAASVPATCIGVVALGAGLAEWGPLAVMGAHALLGAIAALGLLAALVLQLGSVALAPVAATDR